MVRSGSASRRPSKGRWLVLVAFALVGLIAGFWVGEHPTWTFLALPVALMVVAQETGLELFGSSLVLIVLALLLLAFLSSGLGWFLRLNNWWLRIGTAIGLIVSIPIGMMLGAMDVSRAYRQCIEEGEELRSSLEKYRQTNGQYPDSLADVPLENVPGQTLMRDTVLHYARTENGYLACLPGIMAASCLSHEETWHIRGPD